MDKPEGSAHAAEATAHSADILSRLDDLLASESVEQFYSKFENLKEAADDKHTLAFKFGLLIRFIFSCLLDGDRLNTADFEFPSNTSLRSHGKYEPWGVLIDRLEGRLAEFRAMPDRNEVDELREQVSQACLEFSGEPKGIYKLTVPTGGGKTLASLRFALHHAQKHGMAPLTGSVD